MPNARRSAKPRVLRRRRAGLRIPAHVGAPRPRTVDDWERLLGMPAEIEPIPTRFTCSPAPQGHSRRSRHPKLQNEIDQVHMARAAASWYYDQAAEILWRGGLTRLEFRVWEHVCEGRGWPAIKAATGLTKHRIVTVIADICARFDLPTPS
jgi:hypothetical protein